jgi:hypothetical protein
VGNKIISLFCCHIVHHKGHFSSTFVHVHLVVVHRVVGVHLDAANVHHVGICHIVTNVHHVAYVGHFTSVHRVVGAHRVIDVIHHVVDGVHCVVVGVHQVNVHCVAFTFSMDGTNPTPTLSYKLEFC